MFTYEEQKAIIEKANNLISKYKLEAKAVFSIEDSSVFSVLTPNNKYTVIIATNKNDRILRNTILQIKEQEEEYYLKGE